MNVLEKILEEIEERFEYLRKADDACRIYAESDRNFEGMKYFQNLTLATDRAKGIVEEIIRSHMDEIKDCGNCTRRTWYQKGYEDGKDTNVSANDGWIPVSEQLPEEGKEVLAQFTVRVRRTDNQVDKAVYIFPLNYKEGIWRNFENGVPNGEVEYWQPLPAPYKGE